MDGGGSIILNNDIIEFILSEKINYFYNNGLSNITFCNILDINGESQILELPIEVQYIFTELDNYDEIDRKLETISILDEMSATIRTKNPYTGKNDIKLMGKDIVRTAVRSGKNMLNNITNPSTINTINNTIKLGTASGLSPMASITGAAGKVAIQTIPNSIRSVLKKDKLRTYDTANRIINGIAKRREENKPVTGKLLWAEKKARQIINDFKNEEIAKNKASKITGKMDKIGKILDDIGDTGSNTAEFAARGIDALNWGINKYNEYQRKGKRWIDR